MLCFRNFPVAKKFLDKREGEVSRFSFEKFLSPSVEKCRRRTLSLSLTLGIKKVRKRGLGGGGRRLSRFSVQIVSSQSAEKFRRVTLLCFVSEKFR